MKKRGLLFILIVLSGGYLFALEEMESLIVERIPLEVEPTSLGLFKMEPAESKQIERPPLINQYLAQATGINSYHSDKILEKGSYVIPEGQLFQFLPKNTGPYEKWSAQVIDASGKVIKEFSGVGIVPAPLTWDGTEEGWSKVRTNEPYTITFEGVTGEGKKEKEVSDPILLSSFLQRQNKSILVLFSSDHLFSQEGTQEISVEGKSRLLAAAEILSRYPGKPVSMDVYSKDVERGQKQKALSISFLCDLLMKNPDEISAELQVDPNESEEIRIHVLGVGQ